MMNLRGLEDAIEYAVVMTGDHLNKFYHPYALLCNEDDLNVLVSILRSIRVISFNFNVDDPKLNDIPMWVALGIMSETGAQEQRRGSMVRIIIRTKCIDSFCWLYRVREVAPPPSLQRATILYLVRCRET
jgi:hypothetical protein